MDNDEGYDTLEELNELAKTAGALVVGKVRVRRRTIDNATYVGSGKANELSLMGSELEADLFILMMNFPQFSSARLRRPSERALLTEQRLYSIFCCPCNKP